MPKKNRVLVSGRSPVTRDSGGTVTAFPNVCNTPAPGGQVPVPYPNVARSADLKKGSKSVSIDGAPVCLQASELSRSTGDEAGTGGGLMSGQHGGPAHPVSFDFSVRIEGKGVVRNMDLFTCNARNTAPYPIAQQQEAPPVAGAVDELAEETCPYCGKAKHEFAQPSGGNHQGHSQVLASNLLQGKDISTHPWYAGSRSLAAHHLICSEGMADRESQWEVYCRQFGYDIDCRENGVMLPNRMDLACQLQVPLHRGPHAAGFAYDLNAAYVDAVRNELRKLARAVEKGRFCSDPDGLVRALQQLSSLVLGKLAGFKWTITRDGLDYQPGGTGCGGMRRIPEKRAGQPCPVGRRHNVSHAVTAVHLSPGARTLRVGE